MASLPQHLVYSESDVSLGMREKFGPDEIRIGIRPFLKQIIDPTQCRTARQVDLRLKIKVNT
jgi:hypothetical protein